MSTSTFQESELHTSSYSVNSGINLPDFVGIFSVSISLLHMIMLPLRLMGLMIVTVALMKEPLLKVSCPTIDEEFSV